MLLYFVKLIHFWRGRETHEQYEALMAGRLQ